MPVVNYEQYLNMMKAAYDNHYAYPAVNVSSMETANAVLKGLTVSCRFQLAELSLHPVLT